jgi:hypothetical protein
MPADFIVLDQDPYQLDPSGLADLEPCMTVVRVKWSSAGDVLGQKIKSGDICNQAELLALVNSPNLAFEHLDWFPTKSRLAEKSTFCLFSPNQLEAILCVTPEIQDLPGYVFYITHRDGKHKNKFDQCLNTPLVG